MSSPSLQLDKTLLASSSEALRRGAGYLMSLRRNDGYWWADLTADTTLEADFVLLELWRHPPQNGRLESSYAAVNRQGGALDSGPPASRWRVQYLRAGSFGDQRDYQSLYGFKAVRAGR